MLRKIRSAVVLPCFLAALAALAPAQSIPSIDSPPLMPWPASVIPGDGAVSIDPSFGLALSGEGAADPRVRAAVDRLFSRLTRQTGIPLLPRISAVETNPTLSILVEHFDHPAPQQLGDDESYTLAAAGKQIRLSSAKPLGALRGIETFLQLVRQNGSGTPGFSVAAITIRDHPRFPWRGLSLDVARHFVPLDEVKRTIDGLASVKFNVLHLHLSDSEGFRVESRRYPRLTGQGSDGLFYTRAQVLDLIAYARSRGLRIVPEFDMPGHFASWLPGYPELGSRTGRFEIARPFDTTVELLDPTKESSYLFLDGFIGEMSKLFPDDYFHIGGDEIDPKEWNENPRIRAFMKKNALADPKALHTYFNRRLLKIITKYGKHMEGWDEILQPDLPKSILVQSWRGQPSLWQGARQGFQGILSAGYYLDLMYPAGYHYSIDPMKAPPLAPKQADEAKEPPDASAPEPGTPSGLTSEQAKLILGGEAAMWIELATPENLDAKLWPRLAAIAERFWSPESLTDIPSMYRRLAFTTSWLEWLGLTQRSNLKLMRQRLAGGVPSDALEVFASTLEVVKGYSRNAETYTMFSPLNRLVDAIPPESSAAREFRDAVDVYLTGRRDTRVSGILRDRLSMFAKASTEVRPLLERQSLLRENLPAADGVDALCRIGLEALNFLDGSSKANAAWKEHAQSTVAPYNNKRVGDLLIGIAPGVAKLVAAVTIGSP